MAIYIGLKQYLSFYYTILADMLDFDMLELGTSLSCPGRRDSTCAHWDHTVQLYVCCDQFSLFCNMELGRWITAFRRCDQSFLCPKNVSLEPT